MICVLKSMCFPLQSRKSGQLYNAEVCGEVCSLISAFFQVQVRKNTEVLQGHLSFISAWILSHFWSPIQTQYARLWQKASWDWERHFLCWWGLQCLFGKTAASMGQGNQWEGKPWNLGLHSTIVKQFGTSNSPLQSGRWPQPCGNFLAHCYGCTSISSRLPLCSSRESPLLLLPLTVKVSPPVPKMLNKSVLMDVI